MSDSTVGASNCPDCKRPTKILFGMRREAMAELLGGRAVAAMLTCETDDCAGNWRSRATEARAVLINALKL